MGEWDRMFMEMGAGGGVNRKFECVGGEPRVYV
jgi:hypothetical protein